MIVHYHLIVLCRLILCTKFHELQDINDALQQACNSKTETKENDFDLLLSLLAKYQNVIKVSNTKLSNMQVHVQNGVITIKKR